MHVAVFSFTIDVNKNTSCVINLHRVALSRPTAPIQCKLLVIMFIALRFSHFSAFISAFAIVAVYKWPGRSRLWQ